MIKSVFCQKCHAHVINVEITDGDMYQVVKSGVRVGARFKGLKTIGKDGIEHEGLPYPCGHGHTVYIGGQ